MVQWSKPWTPGLVWALLFTSSVCWGKLIKTSIAQHCHLLNEGKLVSMPYKAQGRPKIYERMHVKLSIQQMLSKY